MINRRSMLQILAACVLGPEMLARPARAQSFPSRPVRLIVPNPAGGPVDTISRLITARLAEIWGAAVVVENRPGAGSNIGAEAAARATPDGHTLYMASFSHGVNRFLYPELRYDPVASFAPITLVSMQPCMMVVSASSPIQSVADFVKHAKANAGKITFASTGAGTAPHLSGELLKRMAGIELTHVSYRTVFINEVIAGRIDTGFPLPNLALPLVQAGRLRALAVTGERRLDSSPGVPTMAEAGFPGFNVSSWFGLFVPAGTPPGIVNRINADTVRVLGEVALRNRLEQLGSTPTSSTPAELAKHLRRELDRWGPVIADARIKGDG